MMPYDSHIHHRRSIRLKGYDYTQPGAYFVTLVTQNREPLFGEITDGAMQLNAIGKIIQAVWARLLTHFPIRHDEWIIMPNHLHGIVFIVSGLIRTAPGSLGAIIQNFKSVSIRKVNQTRDMPGGPIWQQNYHEHIVRNE